MTFDGTLISDIKLKEGENQPVTLYKLELDNTGNNFEEPLPADRNNGTLYAEQTLTLALQTLQDADLEDFYQMARGRPAILIQYRNGKCRLAGLERGMDVQWTNVSGGDLGDFQGNNIVMTANENKYAPLLKGYTAANPFAGLATEPIVVTGDPQS